MTHKDMAEGLLDQAKSSLDSARQASQDGNWAFAVRTSQDASELSIKALLLTTGHEPPKVHDLSHALEKSKDQLEHLGLKPNEVESIAATAKDLAEDRSKALYGDERHDVPAERIYGRDDAGGALRAAEKVHERCREVVERHNFS